VNLIVANRVDLNVKSSSKIAHSVTTAAVLATAAEPTAHADSVLHYLGQWQLPHGATVDGTRIGGLSGISYDPQRGLYYVISDDKSDFGKVRFYTARLTLSSDGIDHGEFLNAQELLDEFGNPFRPTDLNVIPPVIAPDAEAIAFDLGRQRMYWTSEGSADPDAVDHPPALLNPWIRIAGLDGSYQGEFTLPSHFAFISDGTSGPRPNGVLEGLSLTPDGRYLFAAMEQPLYQDGPAADENHTGLIRITKFDVERNAAVAQYAYQLERGAPLTGFNGVSDNLALSDTSFLIVERSANLPRAAAVSVYRADVGSASDVLAAPSLTDRPVTLMTKTLVVDLNAIPDLKPLDNIEGITFGPTLPDGRQSVVLVSDDNFLPFEVTQFLAFAM
jgi:hypothetical protein